VNGLEPEVALRPAVEDDYAFFARVYASTREEELAALPWPEEHKRAFLAQQFAAQTAHYAKHYADASFQVVLVDGERAGRLIVARREGAIRIVDIALMPDHRGRGIGTGLLRPLLAEADETRAVVSINVAPFNPALRLYERLGFVAVESDGASVRMERAAGGDQAKTAS
jgi:ribosomal protein S18 acetylase RimI-like enzyme